MNSPRGLLVWGLSLSVALAAAGQQRSWAAEPAQPSAATAPTVKAATTAPPATPVAPARPVAPTPPKAAQPSVAAAVLTTAAAPPVAARPADTGARRDTGTADDTPAGGAGGSGATVTAPAEGMPRGPSIYETGRVGKMGVNDPGARIKHTADPVGADRKELRVQGTPSSTPPAGAGPSGVRSGTIDATVLARELRPRFLLLRDCRVEVARQKHRALKDVPAGRLTLRWTILATGKVGETEVVALSPVDGHVIDCVKRQMRLWTFTPPAGGPAAVERAFKFE